MGAGGEAFFDRGEDGHAPFGGGRAGANEVWFDDGGKANRRTFAFERPINAQMIASENAGSANENAEMRRAGMRRAGQENQAALSRLAFDGPEAAGV